MHCRVEDQSLFGAEVSGGCPATVSERFRALKREAGSLETLMQVQCSAATVLAIVWT